MDLMSVITSSGASKATARKAGRSLLKICQNSEGLKAERPEPMSSKDVRRGNEIWQTHGEDNVCGSRLTIRQVESGQSNHQNHAGQESHERVPQDGGGGKAE